MRLRGGVVIIGSLLWGNDEREEWRNLNLDVEKRILVHLPIRYGRLSVTRKNTYTTVFSKICYWKSYGLGSGWVVPLRASIKSFEDLKEQARRMGKAEKFETEFATRWGCVGLLLNPRKRIDKSVLARWGRLMSSRMAKPRRLLEKYENRRIRSEGQVVDTRGFLRLKWPTEVVSGKRVENFDFLIATATVPKLSLEENSQPKFRYPNWKEIADAMIENDYYGYFYENGKNCITTFQDTRILERITDHSGI